MTITDRIRESRPTNRRTRAVTDHIVVHYTSLAVYERGANEHPIRDEELTGPALVEAFCRGGMAKYTGGAAPYHVLILRDEDGTAEQLLPLNTRGAHCPGYNGRSVAVCYVGNGAMPTPEQRLSLVAVIHDLLLWHPYATVAGHTQLTPKAGGYPCPHPWLSIESLATSARMHLLPEIGGYTQHARDTLCRAQGYALDYDEAIGVAI